MTVYKEFKKMWNKRDLVLFNALPAIRVQELKKTTKSSARLVGDPSTSRRQVKFNIDIAVTALRKGVAQTL
jgi:hypothetical protein